MCTGAFHAVLACKGAAVSIMLLPRNAVVVLFVGPRYKKLHGRAKFSQCALTHCRFAAPGAGIAAAQLNWTK